MLKSPLNYSGGKHDLMPQFLKYFPSPETVNRFYDVFAGGLSVTINSPYREVISNDIIRPMIDFYVNLKNSADFGRVDDEIERIKSFAINKDSQEDYLKVREKFNNSVECGSDPDPYLFFSLVSSCTNNMMRFNKSFKFNQTFGKRSINDNTVSKLRGYCDVLKEKDIRFVCGDYRKLFETFPPETGDFVYLDPPYAYITEAGYNAYWSSKHEDGLYDLIDELDSKGIRFAMSGVSVHKGKANPNMDRLRKYRIVNLDYDYEKVARKKNLGDSQEILVLNY
jgi:DNA adenine methylase Dam